MTKNFFYVKIELNFWIVFDHPDIEVNHLSYSFVFVLQIWYGPIVFPGYWTALWLHIISEHINRNLNIISYTMIDLNFPFCATLCIVRTRRKYAVNCRSLSINFSDTIVEQHQNLDNQTKRKSCYNKQPFEMLCNFQSLTTFKFLCFRSLQGKYIFSLYPGQTHVLSLYIILQRL